MNVVVLSTNFVFGQLVTKASDSAIDDAIQRKIPGQGLINEEKGITSVISNEDMGDIIKIIKPLENVKPDGISERVKHDIKLQEG